MLSYPLGSSLQIHSEQSSPQDPKPQHLIEWKSRHDGEDLEAWGGVRHSLITGNRRLTRTWVMSLITCWKESFSSWAFLVRDASCSFNSAWFVSWTGNKIEPKSQTLRRAFIFPGPKSTRVSFCPFSQPHFSPDHMWMLTLSQDAKDNVIQWLRAQIKWLRAPN